MYNHPVKWGNSLFYILYLAWVSVATNCQVEVSFVFEWEFFLLCVSWWWSYFTNWIFTSHWEMKSNWTKAFICSKSDVTFWCISFINWIRVKPLQGHEFSIDRKLALNKIDWQKSKVRRAGCWMKWGNLFQRVESYKTCQCQKGHMLKGLFCETKALVLQTQERPVPGKGDNTGACTGPEKMVCKLLPAAKPSPTSAAGQQVVFFLLLLLLLLLQLSNFGI